MYLSYSRAVWLKKLMIFKKNQDLSNKIILYLKKYILEKIYKYIKQAIYSKHECMFRIYSNIYSNMSPCLKKGKNQPDSYLTWQYRIIL